MPHAGDLLEGLRESRDGRERVDGEDAERVLGLLERDHHVVLGDDPLLDLVVAADRLVLGAEPDLHAGVEHRRRRRDD